MEAEASLLQVLGGESSFTSGACRDEGDICEASFIKCVLGFDVLFWGIEDALIGSSIIFPELGLGVDRQSSSCALFNHIF